MNDKLEKLLARSAAAVLAGLGFSAITLHEAPAQTPMPWTGLYVGLNAGYVHGSWSRAGSFDSNQFFGGTNFDRHSKSGGLGGGQVGFDSRFGNIVVGAVGDIQVTNLDKQLVPASTDTNSRLVFNNPWFATGRVRAGWAQGQWLVYATGGVSIGRVRVRTHDPYQEQCCAGPLPDQTRTMVGWVAGAGAGVMLAPNVDVTGEFLYVDLGRSTFGQPVSNAVGTNFNTVVHPTMYAARVLLNWHF